MDIEQLYTYCLRKKGASTAFPFDEKVLVFKVLDKVFALTDLSKWEAGDHSVNLKCDPQQALVLRDQYQAIQPAYHMNKKHWNTVTCNQDVPDKLILELIDHSYACVVKGMTRKQKDWLLSTELD